MVKKMDEIEGGIDRKIEGVGPIGTVICGCIWTPPDCNGLDGSGAAATIADVYPAF